MRYPVMVEAGSESSAWGVVVPDLPGCFAAGDTFDEAMASAVEAAATWIEATRRSGREIPPPSYAEGIASLGDFEGWTSGWIELGPHVLAESVF